ncbi:hypothetical protein [Hymenobacter daeguensis]
MTFKSIILSWDLAGAILVLMLSYYLLPDCVSQDFAVVCYNTGVSVLSILFSVYFAALAIILSSSSDEFVAFLEKDGSYSAIIGLYKYTLKVLFIGLVFSIAASVATSYLNNIGIKEQGKLFVSSFLSLFFYGVFCSYNSAKDAISYSMYRMKFLKSK